MFKRAKKNSEIEHTQGLPFSSYTVAWVRTRDFLMQGVRKDFDAVTKVRYTICTVKQS